MPTRMRPSVTVVVTLDRVALRQYGTSSNAPAPSRHVNGVSHRPCWLRCTACRACLHAAARLGAQPSRHKQRQQHRLLVLLLLLGLRGLLGLLVRLHLG